jgi:hypothetical protein
VNKAFLCICLKDKSIIYDLLKKSKFNFKYIKMKMEKDFNKWNDFKKDMESSENNILFKE